MSDTVTNYKGSLQELLQADYPFDSLLQKLVALWEAWLYSGLGDAPSETQKEKHKDEVTNFYLWLTDCMKEKSQNCQPEELRKRVIAKLESLLRRCDSDTALLHYIRRAIKNYAKDNDRPYWQFRRAFCKKAWEALDADARFLSRHDGGSILWGLVSWKKEAPICDGLSGDLREQADRLKKERVFPLIRWPEDGRFASSAELANASCRTLDYECFRFFATLNIIFELLKLTGQFGAALPCETVLEASPDEDRPGDPFERLSAPENVPRHRPHDDDEALVEEFWKSLSLQHQALLACYIIPKADNEKVVREKLRGNLGYRNDVTMKNHEDALLKKLKGFFQRNGLDTSREDATNFMAGLEWHCIELKKPCPDTYYP